ncbi:hypothetical protein [Amycolatopsis sp. TNS106]|uniref:hypothetical protein n=1 Tax=Amycolatopsis sp. TNS106 TaxID=2861750 RepID=UPI001C59819D|nr:hypothetical protein [Amycolatopsis sp. TNS106]
MTILDHAPDVMGSGPVLAELPAPEELDAIVRHLPEQDWCENCLSDGTGEIGMPRDVLGRTPEERNPRGAHEPHWPRLVIWLACGHVIR